MFVHMTSETVTDKTAAVGMWTATGEQCRHGALWLRRYSGSSSNQTVGCLIPVSAITHYKVSLEKMPTRKALYK